MISQGFGETVSLHWLTTIVSCACLVLQNQFYHPGKSLHAGQFFMLWLFSADFFSKLTVTKNSFRNTIRVSSAWSALFQVQTVCKGYLQMTKIPASKERVNLSSRL